ncbi:MULTISPECIES: FAD-dependent oxidoreductase [unclassified Chelatococcus]|uniref:oxidoreductase n=1 Tax=unclassified Chelatococcus TaxID=2638111 RepID=UPI001BD0878D|nr:MULTISPECIES: FAD-dependent oxidoreductase [unclassified Chelatococcus]MBS7700442.1 FAD-dependent oxidoreductase [Chelatococcus sp. YT9]MBX3556238.1 FAD-dependent oxidoreductase [Chelatococcus sp.]
MRDFKYLFEPCQLGRHTAKNRIWMTAHATLLVKDHLFTDEHIAYYVERAKGGVGVITMEAMAAHPTTQPYKGKAFAFDPRMVAQYRKIADAVHQHGVKILAQPWHRGRQTSSVANGLPVWAPSAIPCAVYREMPHVMTQDDIAEIVEGYRLSARYAREGGLDGVEVHGMAHGYLLGQFLSPATNHRNDAYGGSLENRLRIVTEIIDATREETGPDLIVGIRINSDDGLEGGLGPHDWAEIARRLEATGKLDYVSCSHGTYVNRMLIYPTSPEEHGFQLPATRIVKQAVGLPVVGVGRIVTPEEGEAFLADGACDFIGLSRALIADPYWALKAQERRTSEVRPCVGANWCMESIFAQAPIACIHNPAAGAEHEIGEDKHAPATQRKKVAVVGGGPGGMRAAATLARRGHEVTLFEARDRLGGQAAWFTRAEIRKELKGIITHLEGELERGGVLVRLDTRAGRHDLENFEAVVVATGSTPLRHGWTPLRPSRWAGEAVPGTGQPHVLTLADVLGSDHGPAIGRRVVVYDSLGGRQGAVVTDFLASAGHEVTFVTPLGQASPGLSASRDWGKVYGRLRRLGVSFRCDRELIAIGESSIRERDVYTREEHDSPADTVVLVLGSSANDTLFHELRADGRIQGLYMIGDCMAPRRVSDAIREGERVARLI